MQQALTQPNWQQLDFIHWLKHSLLPGLLLLLFLLLPKPWETTNITELPLIEIELKPTTEPTQVAAKPIEPNKPKPVEIKETIGTAGGSPSTPTPTVKASPKPDQQPRQAEPVQVQPSTKIISKSKTTTADILLSAKNRISMDIPAEFQARTGPAKDFYIPEQEIEDWLADIPFLDESVDRPTVEMRFYAEGFTGHIEKYFDKITIKKTFTTKYGTKIHCALVGVLVACVWK